MTTRREFLETSGALVLGFTLAGGAFAQEGAAPKAESLPGSLAKEPLLDAWIRIDAENRVSVFTGKAELGQGVKTALLQIAAEELDVPLGRMRIVTAALETLDFMVSLDVYVNETNRHADVILPGPTPLERTHYAGVLGSSINIAALVTTLFADAGVRTFTPFYDSRMLRLVANLKPRQRFRFRRPKSLLKKSLTRHGFQELAHRSKKSFGQPIFEWLSPGGKLEALVDQIDSYPEYNPTQI